MKKEVTIKITLTDNSITLDSKNLQELTAADSIKVLVSLLETLNILHEGDPTNVMRNFYQKLYNKYIQ